MNVTIVGGSLPYPANAGNRVRTLNLTLRLARRHRITYLYHRTRHDEGTREAEAFLNDHGIATLGVDHTVPPKSGPAFYARLAVNLASPLPYSVASHGGPAVRRAVASRARSGAVDLWQAEGAPYFEPLLGLAGARRVLMAHNIETLIWARYHATESHALRRWYIRQQWRKFEKFERRAIAESTRVVAVSPEDAELVRGQFGVDRVDVVDNGIDRAFFEAVPTHLREPSRVVFLGSFEWRPNLDAVRQMLERIFPEVLAAEPSARLDLVGRNPPEWLVRRVEGLPHVELHANVPDIRPYLARAGMMAVPLRVGGGSRLKILEALASGLPVVSTRVGAEGLHLTPGRDLVVVEGTEDMADALVKCVREPGPTAEMAARGRRLVLDRYDWDTLAEQLDRSWHRCFGVQR
jgi:glycosyltransferase involved in cell wall biosynthesis